MNGKLTKAREDRWTAERVYNLAKAHHDRYLLSHFSFAQKDKEYLACEALVIDGYARWDRNSNLFPCIKLTGKPLGRAALKQGEPM